MTEEQFSKYLVETQGFTNEQATGYIKQVGLEPGIKAMEEQHQLENSIAAPAPQKTIGGSVGAGVSSLADSLTFGNLEKFLPKEALQKMAALKEQYPAESGFGNLTGSAATMMFPNGAITKIPQIAKLVGNSGKLKALANILGGAATGAAYGFAQNPKVQQDELSARVGQMALPAALGGALGLVPGALEKAGEAYYRSPFRKIDSALIKSGKNSISDTLWNRKITGSLSGIEDELQKVLDTELYPEISKVKQGLKDKGYKYSVNDAKNLVLNNLPNESKDVGIANEITGLKNYATDAFDKYTPSGWMKTLRNYAKKNKGYQTEKAAFEAVGGAGEQLPLMGNNIPIRAGDRVKNIELMGQPASVATAEPLEHWTQQGLMSLQTPKTPEAFNVPSGDPLLPLAQNMKMDARTAWMQHGPRYQSEILGLQNTPRSYMQVKVPTQVQAPGQSSFPITPQKLQIPDKKMTVDDYDLLMKRVGQKAKAGFVQTAPGQQTPIPADLMADFYGALKSQRESAVAEQLGPEVANKYKAVNQETSTILNSFKKLSDAAQNEAATSTLTPIEGMYLLNPATAKYALTKEGIGLLKSPYMATNIGKFMNKVGKSNIAPVNPNPALLNAIRNNKIAEPNPEDYINGN